MLMESSSLDISGTIVGGFFDRVLGECAGEMKTSKTCGAGWEPEESVTFLPGFFRRRERVPGAITSRCRIGFDVLIRGYYSVLNTK